MKQIITEEEINSINDNSYVGVLYSDNKRGIIIKYSTGKYYAVNKSERLDIIDCWTKPSKREYGREWKNGLKQNVYLFDTFIELLIWWMEDEEYDGNNRT